MKKSILLSLAAAALALSLSSCGSTSKAAAKPASSGGSDAAQPTHTAESTKVQPALLTLNNGLKMPQFGIGTYRSDDEQAYNAVLAALKSGYRHIDTAHAYQNERGVGRAVNEAIKEGIVTREEIWITSKLWPTDYNSGNGAESIAKMLERLGTDYVDLVYLHQPVGDYMAGYRALENAVRQGKVRAIGLSNFDLNDEVFDDVMAKAEIKPVSVQIELHPYAQRKAFREKCAKYNLQVEGWFPLGGSGTGNDNLFADSVITSLAQKYGKSPAQIILRWHVQEGFSTIPGSRNPAHIAENIAVYNFELSDDDMQKIRSLNREQHFYNGTWESAQHFNDWVIQY